MFRREFVTALGAIAVCGSRGRADEAATFKGTLKQLTQPGSGDNRATYLPDGAALVFASQKTGRSQLWTMDPDGRAPHLLYESAGNDYGRVAPDANGSRLCFSSDRSGENVIYVLDRRTNAVTPVSDPSNWSFGPSWSSRGRIAYFSRRGGNGLNIWTVSPDGANPRQITDRPGESRQPWWSPDGTTLAYSADSGTGMFQLWVTAEDGSGARPLTASDDWQQPFWSPDGRHLAASAKLDGSGFKILVIDANGGGARAIEQPEGDNVHPAWSPDGRSIVFTTGRGDASALWQFVFNP